MTMLPLGRIYFDWASTAIPDQPLAEEPPFGNPSSNHSEGRRARDALEDARCRVARVLGVKPEHIRFTSGGTESNALVVHSLLRKPGRSGLMLSSIEHPSVSENAIVLERLGHPVSRINPDRDGFTGLGELERAFKKGKSPRMVSVMWVNNETGAVMDIPALAAMSRSLSSAPVHFHSDIVQGVGKLALDLGAWDIDSAAISCHKTGGPRGIGALYLRRPLDPIYTGGGQEGGVRPGTENIGGALAFAAALEARSEKLAGCYAEAEQRLAKLASGLNALGRFETIPKSRLSYITGTGISRAAGRAFSPFILQASFDGIPGEVMARSLDEAGFAVSTGSACSSKSPRRPVLEAMGLSEAVIRQGFRISQGWSTGDEDIEALVAAIGKILKTLL